MRKSIYMADPNRSKHLYANMKRLHQIVNPGSGLTSEQKSQLPEDLTFMAVQKGILPAQFKPKAQELIVQVQSTATPNYQTRRATQSPKAAKKLIQSRNTTGHQQQGPSLPPMQNRNKKEEAAQ